MVILLVMISDDISHFEESVHDDADADAADGDDT